MKGSLLTGFRALAFALLALGGIRVKTSADVALFVLGLAAFWALIERVFLNIHKKRRKPPGAP
ncbi:MAG: hypothetical protein EXQ84_07060 [Rhodospirillaceae bacterium]|nr:hypothetical protein [Rhodospirillaceae bacterium]